MDDTTYKVTKRWAISVVGEKNYELFQREFEKNKLVGTEKEVVPGEFEIEMTLNRAIGRVIHYHATGTVANQASLATAHLISSHVLVVPLIGGILNLIAVCLADTCIKSTIKVSSKMAIQMCVGPEKYRVQGIPSFSGGSIIRKGIYKKLMRLDLVGITLPYQYVICLVAAIFDDLFNKAFHQITKVISLLKGTIEDLVYEIFHVKDMKKKIDELIESLDGLFKPGSKFKTEKVELPKEIQEVEEKVNDGIDDGIDKIKEKVDNRVDEDLKEQKKVLRIRLIEYLFKQDNDSVPLRVGAGYLGEPVTATAASSSVWNTLLSFFDNCQTCTTVDKSQEMVFNKK